MRKNISISLSDELLKSIDECCNGGTYSSRSDFVRNAIVSAVHQRQAIRAIMDFNAFIRSVADKQGITEEDMKELQRIESVCNLIKEEGLFLK